MSQNPIPGNDAQYLADCVKIEPLALEEEFVRVPADLAYWNAQYSEAYREWLTRKLATEQIEAQLGLQHRQRLQMEAANGKTTVGEVEQALRTDPHYLAARGKEIAAEVDKVRLYGVLDALRSKRDMLVSIGAQMRAEMQMDPTIRKQGYIERERRDHGG